MPNLNSKGRTDPRFSGFDSLETVEFLGISIAYSTDVLTPRLETESLVLWALERSSGIPDFVLDIGTGSGAIIAAVAKKLGGSTRCLASDISTEALEIAEYNFFKNGVNIDIRNGNLLEPFLDDDNFMRTAVERHLLVIANLPYLTKEEPLGPGVAEEDPEMALYGGGAQGFDCIRKFLDQSLELSKKCSLEVALEMGENQLKILSEWANVHKVEMEPWSDYSGISRFWFLKYAAHI